MGALLLQRKAAEAAKPRRLCDLIELDTDKEKPPTP
jgi:hypothetical protein